MFEPYLTALPGALTMLGSLVYLWARRRRSPRAVGMATAGLVGGLFFHLGGQFGIRVAVDHIITNNGLLGFGPGPAITLIITLQNALLCGCLLLVVAAVVADRRPVADDD